MKLKTEFENYAVHHKGIGSLKLDYYQKQVQASLTPYILEEREMRVTQMDIFSRMLLDRIIWFCTPVDNNSSMITTAQLMFLDNLEVKDITINLNTPGGSVADGLTLLNTFNYIASDIVTINLGTCASMGSVLLGGGTIGKRFALKDSRVMIHQVSSSTSGVISDLRISLQEAEKYNDILFNYLGGFCGKTSEQVKLDAERDNWMSSSEALSYGIIDQVITKKIVKGKNKK